MYYDFVEIWLSHSTEKFRRRTLHFSESFFYRKVLWIGAGISRPSHEIFLSHSTEKIPRRNLLFQKISGLKKLHKLVYHDFVEGCFSHSTEIFRRGLSLSQKVSGIGNFEGKEGVIIYYRRLFLSHSAGKFRKGTILCFRNFLVSKDFMQKRGDHDFVWQIFCLRVPKVS